MKYKSFTKKLLPPFDPTQIGLSSEFSFVSFATLKGWCSKLPQRKLQEYLKDIGDGTIGKETPDCAVYNVPKSEYRQISTCDFFYPLVEDPYLQGKIAVANVLSDIYAMGVTHIDNVLMILGVSKMMKEIEKEITTREMIKGFNDACILAGTSVTGGQTVVNPWPMIGGTAISTVKQKDIIYPGGACHGDLLVLTKPLGTQVVVNCVEWLRKSNEKYESLKELKISDSEIWDMNSTACESMSRLNRKASELMIKYNAHGSTDITGFGFKGHLENLVEAQKNCVEFYIDTIPVIKNTDKINNEIQNFKLLNGYSPETSGGLLIALAEKEAHKFIQEMEDNNESAWIVGKVIESDTRKVTICNMIDIINI